MTSSQSSVSIKLCGMRSVEDACSAVRAGADAIGLILLTGTPRSVNVETAATITRVVRDYARALGRWEPELVAVVGRQAPEDVLRIVDATGVDAVQIVGDEPDAIDIARVLPASVACIRVIAVADEAAATPLALRAADWEARGARVLFDTALDGSHGGGTGVRARNRHLGQLLELGNPRGIAGGLTPDNVADVIAALHPAFVDVSSGIEAAAGRKDADRMRAFVAAARAALLDPTDLDSSELNS